MSKFPVGDPDAILIAENVQNIIGEGQKSSSAVAVVLVKGGNQIKLGLMEIPSDGFFTRLIAAGWATIGTPRPMTIRIPGSEQESVRVPIFSRVF